MNVSAAPAHTASAYAWSTLSQAESAIVNTSAAECYYAVTFHEEEGIKCYSDENSIVWS